MGRALTNDAKICRPDSTLLCAISAIHDLKRAVFWAQKNFKKVKKRLATPWRLPLEGNFERQMPSFRRSKKIQKSEKKACQGLRNLITVLNLTKPMEKLMTQNALKTFRFVRLALMASVGFPLILASNAFAQLPAPAVPAEPGAGLPASPRLRSNASS